MLDLTHLQSFLAVYRQGNITRAALGLHLSQPAVSLHLKLLEGQVGKALFDRVSRGVVPTPAAHELAREVGPHLDALAAVAVSADAGTDVGGTLWLGGPADLLAANVLPALSPLVEQGVRIRARPGLVWELVDRLVAGELELVVATKREPRPGIDYDLLFEEEFVLVGHARWAAAFAGGRIPSTEELAAIPWIAFDEDLPIVRRYARQVLDHKLDAVPAIVIPDLRAILATVAAGAGLSVLPRYLCTDALASGDVVELQTPTRPPRNPIYLANKATLARQPRLQAAKAALKRAAASWV